MEKEAALPNDFPTDGVEFRCFLKVSDYARSLAFYRDVLGATEIRELVGTLCFLSFAGSQILLSAQGGSMKDTLLATWHIRSQNSSLRLLLLAICLARETREREKQGFSSRSSREKPQAYEKIMHLENVLRKDMPKVGQRASTGIFAHSSVSDHCPVDSI